MKAQFLFLAIAISLSVANSRTVNACNSNSNNAGVPTPERKAGRNGWKCARKIGILGHLTYRSTKGTKKTCRVYPLQLYLGVKLTDSLLVRGHCLIANRQTGEFYNKSDMTLSIRFSKRVIEDIIVHDYGATKNDDDDNNIGLIKFSPPFQKIFATDVVTSSCITAFPPNVAKWIAEQVETSKGLPCIIGAGRAGQLTFKSSPKAAPCIVYLIQLHPHIKMSSTLLTWGNCLLSDTGPGALRDPADLKLRLNGGVDKNVTGTLVYDYTATGYHNENIGLIKFRPSSSVSDIRVIGATCLSQFPDLVYDWIEKQLVKTQGWDCLSGLVPDGSLNSPVRDGSLAKSPVGNAAKCSNVYVPCLNCEDESDQGHGDVAITRAECLFRNSSALEYYDVSNLTLSVNGLKRTIKKIGAFIYYGYNFIDFGPYVHGINSYTDLNIGLVKFDPPADVKGFAIQGCVEEFEPDIARWIKAGFADISEAFASK